MSSFEQKSAEQKALLDQAVKSCKQALVKNSFLNEGKVNLSGPHSARFSGGEHEGWNKPLTKKYVFAAQ